MVGLQIGNDEEILIESSGVWWISKLRNLNQHFNVLVLLMLFVQLVGCILQGNLRVELFKSSLMR